MKGDGMQQDYGMRVYDARLGRFLSTDPLSAEYPWNSSYAFAENDVTRSIDLEGAEKHVQTFYYAVSNGTTVATVKSNDYVQPEGTFNLGSLFGLSPKTDEQEAAGGFIEVHKLPAGGTFSFFEFSPELGKTRYARYDYVDIGGKQQSQYFDGSEVDFMLKKLATTPTSTDPVVSTIYATHGEEYGKGILQIAYPKNLQGVEYSSNVLSTLEKEIGIGMTPAEFTTKASITITSQQACGILSEMGIQLPSKVKTINDVNMVLENTPRLNDTQVKEFYKKASTIGKN